MRQQKALTIITPIKRNPEALRSLDEVLRKINAGEAEHPVDFKQIGTTHFAAWIILGRDRDGGVYPPSLVFECNYEGRLNEYIRVFIAKAGDALRDIYMHCEGFDQKDNESLRKYLLDHRKRHAAFFVGCPYQSQQGILDAQTIRGKIEDF